MTRIAQQVVTHQPAISFSISLQYHFNRAGGRTSNVGRKIVNSNGHMNYEEKWRIIRKNLRRRWFLFLGSCLLVPLIAGGVMQFFGMMVSYIVFVILAINAIIQQSRLARARMFPCPRCGEPFRHSGLYGITYTCQKCTLLFGQGDDDCSLSDKS
jgi:predicted RNA-binding Zn-ribbon protein involved in translation (DUF1610 family)